MVEYLRRDLTQKSSKRTVVPRLGGECLTSKEVVERISRKENDKVVKNANQAAAKAVREDKKLENLKRKQEAAVLRAQAKVKKAEEKESQKSSRLIKKDKNKKIDDQVDLNFKKNCFKCGLIHGNDTESNKLMWGNCEFSFKCPNWYCPKCIPPRTSMSDELICSDCK